MIKSLFVFCLAMSFSCSWAGIYRTNDIYKAKWDFVNSDLATLMTSDIGVEFDNEEGFDVGHTIVFNPEDLFVVQDIVRSVFATYNKSSDKENGASNGTMFFNSCNQAYSANHVFFNKNNYYKRRSAISFASKKGAGKAHLNPIELNTDKRWYNSNSDLIKLNDYLDNGKKLTHPYCEDIKNKEGYPIASINQLKSQISQALIPCFLVNYSVGAKNESFITHFRTPTRAIDWNKENYLNRRSISFCYLECVGEQCKKADCIGKECERDRKFDVGYRCDATGGSSGSPLMCKIEGKWHLTAIDRDDDTPKGQKEFYNNTKLHSNTSAKTEVMNYGIIISE